MTVRQMQENMANYDYEQPKLIFKKFFIATPSTKKTTKQNKKNQYILLREETNRVNLRKKRNLPLVFCSSEQRQDKLETS